MGEHILLGICVSQVGEQISLGVCVSQVGEHISLSVCVSQVGEHISQGICVFQVGEHILLGTADDWLIPPLYPTCILLCIILGLSTEISSKTAIVRNSQPEICLAVFYPLLGHVR